MVDKYKHELNIRSINKWKYERVCMSVHRLGVVQIAYFIFICVCINRKLLTWEVNQIFFVTSKRVDFNIIMNRSVL